MEALDPTDLKVTAMALLGSSFHRLAFLYGYPTPRACKDAVKRTMAALDAELEVKRDELVNGPR
ncbi:hypothetical protein [Rhodococcus pyridinivorans]|uniref:hypothetical protein n=1 Tax=Rhodococcus pyridinivorans TaxID=103816 RepID=UPI003AAE9122